jgi:multicomponent Na+:H+ antiporter subunit E
MTLVAHIILALLWTVLIGPYSLANFIVGAILGFGVIWISTRGKGRSNYANRVVAIIGLIAFTLKELVVANFRVAYYTLSPLKGIRPAVFDVPLEPDSTDLEITLLAGLITLTPGTLTIDLSPDRMAMRVHAMHVPNTEAAIREIKHGFERRILGVTR